MTSNQLLNQVDFFFAAISDDMKAENCEQPALSSSVNNITGAFGPSGLERGRSDPNAARPTLTWQMDSNPHQNMEIEQWLLLQVSRELLGRRRRRKKQHPWPWSRRQLQCIRKCHLTLTPKQFRLRCSRHRRRDPGRVRSAAGLLRLRFLSDCRNQHLLKLINQCTSSCPRRQ